MRPATAMCFFLLLLGSLWLLYEPATARLRLDALRPDCEDTIETQLWFLHSGHGANKALLDALDAPDRDVALTAARLLALKGDLRGEQHLIRALRDISSESARARASRADVFLLSLWANRDAPPQPLRAKTLAGADTDAKLEAALNKLMENYPAWGAGLLWRTKLSYKNGDPLETRRYALLALRQEPLNYEAVILLGRAFMAMQMPAQALDCFERAVGINPRTRENLAAEIQDALRQLDVERARKRREQRRTAPVAARRCCEECLRF